MERIKKMKEMIEKWNLQMFAEDGEAEPEVEETNAPEEAGEDKLEQKPKEEEKKYSDKEVNDIVNKKFAKWKA